MGLFIGGWGSLCMHEYGDVLTGIHRDIPGYDEFGALQVPKVIVANLYLAFWPNTPTCRLQQVQKGQLRGIIP